jgi:hypothetical protein
MICKDRIDCLKLVLATAQAVKGSNNKTQTQYRRGVREARKSKGKEDQEEHNVRLISAFAAPSPVMCSTHTHTHAHTTKHTHRHHTAHTQTHSTYTDTLHTRTHNTHTSFPSEEPWVHRRVCSNTNLPGSLECLQMHPSCC